ncbi:MAG: OsmC family protein [Anaerolineae bacterium]
MAEILREGAAVWQGDLRKGKGIISTQSGVLDEVGYSFGTRFEDKPGTNPEELIASAHAACYCMALASTLKKKGYEPESVEALAVCTLQSLEGGGWKIAKMQLNVRGQVPGLDQETFEKIAMEADQGCPVSNLLRCGLEISHRVNLL